MSKLPCSGAQCPKRVNKAMSFCADCKGLMSQEAVREVVKRESDTYTTPDYFATWDKARQEVREAKGILLPMER